MDHLEALRWHLIRTVVVISGLAIFAFFQKEFLFDEVILGPKNEDFITYIKLCELSTKLNEWFPSMVEATTLCIGKNLPNLQNLTMSGQFMTHLTVSIISGLILGFPFLVFELWNFIKPALHQKERKMALGIVFFVSLLFFIGILFGYYIVMPLSVDFLLNYKISETVLNTPTLDNYMSTLTTIVLSCGLVFELPILVYFLSSIGIISPKFLKTYRKHAFVGALILAAIITPPDVFSQLLVTVPILLLYEISIYISAVVTKKNENS